MLKKTLNGGNELAESKNWKEIHCSNFERRERKGFHIQSINYLSASTECLKVISLSNLEEEKRIRFIEISNLSSFFLTRLRPKKKIFCESGQKREREEKQQTKLFRLQLAAFFYTHTSLQRFTRLSNLLN